MPPAQPLSGFVVAPLLQTPTVTVRDVCCHGGPRGRAGEEQTDETQLVFPYRGAYVRHRGPDDAVAEANQVLLFSAEMKALVSGGYALKGLASEIELRTPAGEARASLAIPGLHNVRNALAAAACAFALGVKERTIADGLSDFRPYTGRLQVKSALGGATVIDDSYNANPDSVRAAIDVLASCPAPTALVLGDMGEVGAQGPQFHREVGAYARARGIDRLLALGEAAAHAVDAFGSGATHFATVEELVSQVEGRTILVKGSRFMKMERVVAALTGSAERAH